MIKGNKALKAHKKAQVIKGGAVGTFVTAINKVQEANSLLDQANALDSTEISRITEQMEALHEKRKGLFSSIAEREDEFVANLDLIERLNQFS